MTLLQAAVLVAFLAVFAAVYVSTAWMLLHRLWRRFKKQPEPQHSRGVRWMRAIVFTLAGLGVGCMAYGYFIEPNYLAVDRVQVTSPHLPARHAPIRIVHISDLHCEGRPRLEDKVVAETARLKPDLICFTGDAANNEQGVATFRHCIDQLAKLAPVYACAGNWDFPSRRYQLYQGSPAVLLQSEGRSLDINGVPCWIAGTEPFRWFSASQAMKDAPPGAVRILLAHYPSDVLQPNADRADLVLSGHTHGGQVALPWYGALVTLVDTGKKYESGLYRVGKTWLYVSRGVGMEGRVPPVRFCAPPQITLIEILPEPPTR